MISEQHLHKIRLAVADIFGWDIKEDRMDDLERGLLETAHELGLRETPGEIENWLRNISWTTKELDILTTYLTVGETYFFREKGWLEIFQDQIIPELIRNRAGKDQSIRIWSAGCCSGEEPYSLAMLLNENIPDLRNWNISILGTDVNRTFLNKAEKGIYTAWSFRETSASRKELFFTPAGDAWQIDPKIKNQVRFTRLNLAEDHYPSASTRTEHMDVIFCRNVLMYFTPEQTRKVIQRLYQSLADDGWLIVSAVELHNTNFTDFNAVKFGSYTVYRKSLKPVQQNAMPAQLNRVKSQSAIQQTATTGPHPVSSPVKHSHRTPATGKEQSNLPPTDAITLFNQGQYVECASLCESLILKAPDNIEVLAILVRSKANLGLLDEAGRWSQILAMQPNVSADHFYLIANVLFENKDVVSAGAILKRALYLDPHHLMSHFLLGTISNKSGHKHAALKHLQNVKELLSQFEDQSLVPGSDGMTAGRFREMLDNLI